MSRTTREDKTGRNMLQQVEQVHMHLRERRRLQHDRWGARTYARLPKSDSQAGSSAGRQKSQHILSKS